MMSIVRMEQYMDQLVVIFSPGSGPVDKRPIRTDNLIDSIIKLYVTLTFKRPHLIKVASLDYEMDHCPV